MATNLSPPPRNGAFKLVAGVLGSALITLGATWAAWGGKPDRDEVLNLIQTTAPYVEDRRFVNELAESVDDLTTVVGELRVEVAALRVEIQKP